MSDETSFGRVVDALPVGACTNGRVLRGREQQTNLPAVVFVLAPQHCSESDQRWLLVRQLRPRPEVSGPTVIEAQSTPSLAFVCVAWPETALDPSFTPPALAAVIAAFLSGDASISTVLAKLSEIEPRGVPATVAINSQQMPAVWPPRAEAPATAAAAALAEPPAATTILAEPGQANTNKPLPIGQTRILSPNALATSAPTPTRTHSPAPEGRTYTPRSQATASAGAARPSTSQSRSQATPKPDRQAAPRKPRGVPAFVLWLGPSALVIVALLIVWATTRPDPATSAATKGAPPSPVPPPQALPDPVKAAPLEATAPEVAKAPPAIDRQQARRGDDEAATPKGLPIVVLSAPAGAQVCDPRTGKVMGTTPLGLPLEQWRQGYKLVLTAPGYSPAELRWPPKRKIRLERLGDDELQPASPCLF